MNKKIQWDKVKKPEGMYRPFPFWSWNTTMDEENIRSTIKDMKEYGFGGAFVHPRPGLTNEYLGEEWFSLWKYALAEAKRQGLYLGIYDENTYPTGYAGGHIMSQYPDCAAKSVKVRIFRSAEEYRRMQEDPAAAEEQKTMIRFYEAGIVGDGYEIIADLTDRNIENIAITAENRCLIGISYNLSYASPWFGGFPIPDLLRKEVTQALLETTYEAYASHFAVDFGNTIPAAFSDEPGISPGMIDLDDPTSFPFSGFLSQEFYERNGYSLEDVMAAIPLHIKEINGMPAEKIRFDYYNTLRCLWIENFAVPVERWCEEHGLAWTGHFLDEHWPYPWGCCSPSLMTLYAHMHWPGIDMLMTKMLKDDGTSAMILSLKELASVGSQLGKERLLCECWGAGGWDARIEDFKRIGDWLAVGGITFFNPHLTMTSISGVRKCGHPQSFDRRQPWKREFAELSGYLGRLSWLMSRGKQQNSILLLHPTLTWYTRRPFEQQGNILWQYDEMQEDGNIKSYIELVKAMDQNNCRFDLGDEFLIQEYGRIEQGRCVVGEAGYDLIVIPAEMEYMLGATACFLQEAARCGVSVLRLGEIPAILDKPVEMEDGTEIFTEISAEALIMEKGQSIAGGKIKYSRRITGGGEALYFFVNSTSCRQEGQITLPAVNYSKVDLFTGEKTPVSGERCREGTLFDVVLESCESLFLLGGNFQEDAGEEACGGRSYEAGKVKERIHELCDPASIERLDDNVLVLDYGTLLLRGVEYQEISMQEACRKTFLAHGFECNPWDMSIQYKRRVLDRNRFGESSGCQIEVEFWLKEIPDKLYFAAEQGHMGTLEINEKPVEWQGRQRWMDENISAADIRPGVWTGKNKARITYRPFDVLLELQPVYLLGDFTVQVQEGKFWLAREKQIKLGSLKEQGYPFYGKALIYSFDLQLDVKKSFYELRIGASAAAAIGVYVNENYAGNIGSWDGGRKEITQWMRSGKNEIKLHLSATLKNVFGPFHTREPIRRSAWPAAWKQGPGMGMPDPETYDVIEYGLMGGISIAER